jgi:hypothetical protein
VIFFKVVKRNRFWKSPDLWGFGRLGSGTYGQKMEGNGKLGGREGIYVVDNNEWKPWFK